MGFRVCKQGSESTISGSGFKVPKIADENLGLRKPEAKQKKGWRTIVQLVSASSKP